MQSMHQLSQQKNIYVVLGMARSGTSVITNGLKTLGIDLGEKLYRADERNPKGFWEDEEIVYKINENALLLLNHPWMSIRLLKKCELVNNPVLQALQVAAVQLLSHRFKTTDHWAFKDPRTVTLLPFWQSVFNVLGMNEKYVIVLRNPLGCAHSYQKLAKQDVEIGLLLWLMHLISAVEETWERKKIIVSYELMLDNPQRELVRIHHDLSIPFPLNHETIEDYAKQFLDKKLHHYVFNLAELKSHPAIAVVPLCVKVYELLLQLAGDEITFDTLSFQTAWKEIKKEFTALYPVYSYINTLLQRNKQSQKTLHTIRKSLPWKISYPLRLLDDTLRTGRKKRRAENKLRQAGISHSR